MNCVVYVTFSLLFCLPPRLEAASNINNNNTTPKIYGFSLYEEIKPTFEEDYIVIPASVDIKMSFYGIQLHAIDQVSFSPHSPITNQSTGADVECDNYLSSVYPVESSVDGTLMSVIKLRALSPEEENFYFCARLVETKKWYYQGNGNRLIIRSRTPISFFPIWVQIIMCILLFMMSGLFSGLNLGLMSLNPNELRLVENSGSVKERLYAKRIRPVRQKGNFLLCTLLLGNVLVNSLLTIFMDNLTGSGLTAVVVSTLGITMFGEIIPQAVCSRYGLAVGANTIWVTKLFMVLTAPLSFPISLVLDKVLGEEMGQEYSREKLRELITQQGKTGNMADDEVNIITGALSLTTKTVKDVMTPLHDAYMLSHDAVLDFDTLNEIVRHGFTRIPVYLQDRNTIHSVLNVKDLAFIDPDARTPVSTVCKFYQRPILIVHEKENLDQMLKVFRTGKTHMAFVENVVQDGECDPYREMVGLVTLEDVIEEIIQAEIVDETDTVTDNVRRKKRQVFNQDFSVFQNRSPRVGYRLTPQLKIAALRHLSCAVDSFKESYIDISVLSNLLNSDIVREFKFKKTSSENELYHNGQTNAHAILILQGYVLVEITAEKLTFQAGAFMLFGESMLEAVNDLLQKIPADEWKNIDLNELPLFKPEYTVRASSDLEYLSITSRQYLLARIQSKLLENRRLSSSNDDPTNPDAPEEDSPSSPSHHTGHTTGNETTRLLNDDNLLHKSEGQNYKGEPTSDRVSIHSSLSALESVVLPLLEEKRTSLVI